MNAALRLYELAGALAQVADALLESGGELTPEIAERLAQLEGAFDAKVERVLLLAQTFAAESAAAQGEADRLAALAAVRATAARRLKEYVLSCLEQAGRERVETALIRARIQLNSRPTIQWTGRPEALPAAFQRVSIALDGQRAYDAWRAGEPLPAGFVVERGRHLRVT